MRVLAGAALAPAVVVFALTAVMAIGALVPNPDVYLEGHEIPTFGAIALGHLAVVAYAIWGLARFVRGRSAPFGATALAYIIGGAATPFVYLLAVRWFSGG